MMLVLANHILTTILVGWICILLAAFISNILIYLQDDYALSILLVSNYGFDDKPVKDTVSFLYFITIGTYEFFANHGMLYPMISIRIAHRIEVASPFSFAGEGGVSLRLKCPTVHNVLC